MFHEALGHKECIRLLDKAVASYWPFFKVRLDCGKDWNAAAEWNKLVALGFNIHGKCIMNVDAIELA